MFTKEVTFEDFEGKEVTRTFHFNLTKFEVLEINLIDDINEIMAATDWQQHTVRGALAGAITKKLGRILSSDKIEARGRVYRIAKPSI